jgi:hypothetical protein
MSANGFQAKFIIGSNAYTVRAQVQFGQLQVLFNLDGDDSLNKTGSGKAFLVFSTVIKIVQEFLDKTPDIMMFSFTCQKAETTRVKLYDKFAAKVSQFMPDLRFVDRNYFPAHGGIYLYMFLVDK